MPHREPAWVDAATHWAGAYLHIPFCASVCPYCDFAVVEGRDDVVGRYIEAIEQEIARESEWRSLDAIFVGGGTPSHVDPDLLGRLLHELRERYGFAPDAEVTLEANPEDWTSDRATRLVHAGFTRVSFGVQSFDDHVLGYLGRRHTSNEAIEAVSVARAGGFGSVGIDLIMGSPGESLDSWRGTVETAVGLEIDHVSAYCLTVERGTPLGRAVAAGAAAPDPDDQADKYEHAQQAFTTAGLFQYEVSNYARIGHECRYNLTAWAQGEYLAFGMGAHGHRHGRRTWRVRRLDTYLELVEGGESPVQGSERLEGDAREHERLMVGLRRTAGVVAGPLGDAWASSIEGRRFGDAGVVAYEAGRLVVRRHLLTDAVIRSVLAMELD